jgi:DNA-binding NtrC family response regulator
VLTILVVDDDPEQRETLAEVLGDRNQVVLAEDADQALDKIAAAPTAFDLILTDLRMPGRTGIELRRELQAQDRLVPVVLMSSDHHVSQVAADEGFYDHLAKPLSLDLVEAIVARVASDKLQRVSTDLLPDLATATTPGPLLQKTAPDDGEPEG